MSYLVLARKYRPQTFADVVQQQQVTQTLANAITANRVAHAILFTGPRGTGKTTIARILAKAMNCEKGPTPTPCNECRSCLEITSGHATDVFEIDGASNNSVNEVRELRSNIKFLPAHSPHKIYIIDEVHMLSNAAFNALLKTLEEPPAHVMFLFATTEPHKIPATILSRCQRHDLSLIAIDAVTAHLKTLCEKESFTIDEKSLDLIAREAGGSIRDSLSLLDQIMSSADQSITHEMVLDVLGIIDKDMLAGLSAAVFNRDLKQALNILSDAYRQGYDIKKLYSEILEHFRNLLILKLGKGAEDLLSLPTHEIEQMQAQTADVSDVTLSQILSLLLAEEETVRFSSRPKIAVEMVFIKLLHTAPALPLDQVIEKIETLKDRFLEIGPGEATPALPAKPSTAKGLSEATPPTYSTAAAPAPHEPAGTPPGNHLESPPAASPSAAESPVTSNRTAPPPQDPDSAWEKILSIIDERSPKLAASLVNSTLAKMNQQVLEIDIYGSRISLDILKQPDSMTTLKQICAEVLAVPRIDIKLNNAQATAPKPAEAPAQKTPQPPPSARPMDPLVMEALDIFEGEIVTTRHK